MDVGAVNKRGVRLDAVAKRGVTVPDPNALPKSRVMACPNTMGRRITSDEVAKGAFTMPADVVATVARGQGRKAMRGTGEQAAQHAWSGALKSEPKPATRVTASKRFFSADQRTKMADKGTANKDGTYPIKSKKDAKNALRLARSGHGSPADRASAISRAEDELSKRYYDPEAQRQRRQGVAAGAAGVTGSGLVASGFRGRKRITVTTAKVPKKVEAREGNRFRVERKAGTKMVAHRTLKVPFKAGGKVLGGAALIGGAGATVGHMNSRRNDVWR